MCGAGIINCTLKYFVADVLRERIKSKINAKSREAK
jgi:hypothetical protein